jgi:hypothetical protein
MPSCREVAWAAGLFEGEGCITYGSDKRYPRLQLRSTDKDIVLKFVDIIGVGSYVEEGTRSDNWKDVYFWQVGGSTEVKYVLELLLPFLGKRRTEAAHEALNKIKNIRSYNTKKREDELLKTVGLI